MSHRQLDPVDVAGLVTLVGSPVPVVGRPHVEYATVDTIRAFARGYGDDNPRFSDEGYAEPVEGLVGPPLFALATGVGVTTDATAAEHLRRAVAGVSVRVGTEQWTLPGVIRAGMRLLRRDEIAAVEPGPDHDGSPSVTITTRSTYLADGVTVAVRDRGRTYGGVAMDAPVAGRTARHVYTPDQIAAIDTAYAAQRRRGAEVLRMGDVTVGDEVVPIVKGPLTVTDLVCYRAGVGAGPFDVEPLRLAYLNRLARPGFYDRDPSGGWDARERLHWDDEYARSCGHPGAYDYSHTRLNWAVHLLTDWMGDAARLRAITLAYHDHNYVGDTHRVGATVTTVDHDARTVHLAWYATNQLGVCTCSGEATVQLES